jgi:hypothetical protein
VASLEGVNTIVPELDTQPLLENETAGENEFTEVDETDTDAEYEKMAELLGKLVGVIVFKVDILYV